jgi:hypothetical protein
MSWKKILEAVVTVCLVVPVPVFAFNFDQLKWGDGTTMVSLGNVTPLVPNDPLFFPAGAGGGITVTPDSTNHTTTLTFNLPADQVSATGTTTIVSSAVDANVTIKGSWTNLSALQPQSPGSPITITVGTTSTNNMFGQTYSTSMLPPSGTTALNDSFSSSQQVITVKFDYDGFYKPIPSSPASITLTFNN